MKTLFWDFDGTIVYPNRKWINSLVFSFQSNGYSIAEEDALNAMRNGTRRYGPVLEYPDRTGEMWWVDLFDRLHYLYKEIGCSEESFDGIDKVVREEVIDQKNYILYEDLEETLLVCRELGYDNYVLSNNFPDLDVLIGRLGIAPYFKGIFSSGAIGYEKPHKNIFAYALRESGTADISVMIGDNVRTDIAGATNAGLLSVLVHSEPDNPLSATVYCRELKEIPAVLKSMEIEKQL